MPGKIHKVKTRKTRTNIAGRAVCERQNTGKKMVAKRLANHEIRSSAATISGCADDGDSGVVLW